MMTRSRQNAAFALALLTCALAPLHGQTPFLRFPIPGYAPYGNGLISSAFDHHSGGALTHEMPDASEYQLDDVVRAYTGEEGREIYGFDPAFTKGYRQQGGADFALGGNYLYTGTGDGQYLYYDGHPGVDFSVAEGTQILAAAAGTVVEAGWFDPNNHNAGVGLYVKISHPNGYYTIYGHLSEVSVSATDTVSSGTQIGLSGATGAADGAHLHFQVRIGNDGATRRNVDPYGYNGAGVLWDLGGQGQGTGTVGESAVFAFDTRESNSTTAAESAVFAFDTRAIDGLSGFAKSGTFVLDTRVHAVATLSIEGPGSIPANKQWSYQCFVTYSDGFRQKVTESANWSLGGVVPGGTVIAGGNLRAGKPGTPSTVQLRARYETVYGQRDGVLPVVIGDEFTVAIGLSMQLLGGNSYSVSLRAYPSGGATPISYAWDNDGDGQFDDLSGATPSFVLVANGVPRRISVRATDALNREATFRVNLPVDKPTTAGQPVKYAPASSVGASSFLNQSGGPFTFDLAKTGNGLIVICHGADDDGKEDWLQNLMENIEARNPAADRPNILVYDWSEDASPAPTLGDLFDLPAEVEDTRDIAGYLAKLTPEYQKFAAFLEKNVLKGKVTLAEALKDAGFRRFAKALKSVDLDTASTLVERYEYWADGLNFAGNFLIAQAHAQILAAALETEAASTPQRVDFSKPIHFIGDGEGGWLLAEAALLLKDKQHYVDRVTTLDTTMLMKYHAEELPNPGYFERIISSAQGDFFWPIYYLPSSNSYRSSVDIRDNDFLYLTSGLPWFHHERARNWYHDSAQPTAELASSGFYFSPFVNGPKIPKGGGAFAAAVAMGAPLEEPAAALDGFSTFGNVTETDGVFTITENGDAGIFKNLTLPPGATKLEFNFRFSGTTDGDVLGVRFGTRPEFYLGLDTALARGDFHRASVFIGRYAAQTDSLIFTLVSRGANAAVLEIKDVEITETEDPDGDGVDNATEVAAGTNTWLPDSDWDGWDDAYELNVSLTNPTLADSDGDGATDPLEVVAGTIPTDNASYFAVFDAVRNAGGAVTLRWHAVAGKSYRVHRSTTAEFSSFDVIAADIPGATPLTSYTDANMPPGATQMFYRVAVSE
jgi:Peptidase family M23